MTNILLNFVGPDDEFTPMSDIPTYCFSIISFYTIPLTFFLVSKDYIEEFLFLFLMRLVHPSTFGIIKSGT